MVDTYCEPLPLMYTSMLRFLSVVVYHQWTLRVVDTHIGFYQCGALVMILFIHGVDQLCYKPPILSMVNPDIPYCGPFMPRTSRVVVYPWNWPRTLYIAFATNQPICESFILVIMCVMVHYTLNGIFINRYSTVIPLTIFMALWNQVSSQPRDDERMFQSYH